MKDLAVLFEDTDILIVNKPAGIASQLGEGIRVSVPEILERQTGAKVFPVHRLDRDTAGILLVAKHAEAARFYTQLITSGALVKEYRAICFGAPLPATGKIEEPAGRADNRKPALTYYRTLSRAAEFALLSLDIKTGRMHQIRMHLAGIGNPIVADDKYGDFPRNRDARQRYGVRKLQLAACSLTLPVGGVSRTFTIDLPEHLLQLAEKAGIICSP